MATDVSSILRLADIRGRIILFITGFGTGFVALLNLNGGHSMAAGIVAVALLIVGLVLLAQPSGEPFALVPTIGVMIVVAALTVVQSWNVIDPSALGYSAWHFGAVTFLCMVLALRGRRLLAWIAFATVALITIASVIQLGNEIPAAINSIARQSATLFVGTLLASLLGRANRRILAIHDTSITRARAEAATTASERERTAQNERLDRDARPALERILRDEPFTDAELAEFARLEASLRDGIRAIGLSGAELLRETDDARRRGVHVVLLDDRGDELSTPDRQRVETAVIAELGALSRGTLTARLSPVGRDHLATIVVDDGATSRRVVITATGVTIPVR